MDNSAVAHPIRWLYDSLTMSDELMKSSLRAWKDMLSERRTEYPFSRLADAIDFSKPEATLGTDDFTLLMRTFAESIGIDLQTYGRNLAGSAEQEKLLEYHVGIAFRFVFEAEGHYVEIPSAYTLYKVPTRFLIIMGAVLIGIATGKAAQLNALLAGAVGGAASLLINILAERYTRASSEPDLTWTEEFVLKFLKIREPVSLSDLHKQTNLNKAVLKKTLDRLVDKRFVARQSVINGKRRTTVYYLER